MAAGWAVLSVVLTLTLALNDQQMKERFARDQFSKEPGVEINRNVEQLLNRGCTVFTAISFVMTIAKFQPFLAQMQFFTFNLPMDAVALDRLSHTKGCMAMLFPLSSHPDVMKVIATVTDQRGLRTIVAGKNFELMATSP